MWPFKRTENSRPNRTNVIKKKRKAMIREKTFETGLVLKHKKKNEAQTLQAFSIGEKVLKLRQRMISQF